MKGKILYIVLALGVGCISALSGTRYVSVDGNAIPPYTNWDDSSTNLQMAIDLSKDGDEIIVSNGVYAITNQISIEKGICVRGLNGTGQTMIDGSATNRCVFVSHPEALLTGFTVLNGYLEDPPESYHGGGAGVCVWEGGTVSNCVIRENRCVGLWSNGGGVYLGTNALLIDCEVSFNEGDRGGGVGCNPGATVERCRVIGNIASEKGAGICFYSGGVCIKNCEVIHNAVVHPLGIGGNGGGIYSSQGGSVEDCLIAHNTNDWAAAGVYVGRDTVYKRCIIRDNVRIPDGGNGGGATIELGRLEHCLLFSNHDDLWGGGVYLVKGAVLDGCTIVDNNRHGLTGSLGSASTHGFIIRNSIIYGNDLVDVDMRGDPGVFHFTNCVVGTISATLPGAGNQTGLDPGFINANQNDFRLLDHSICIDGGVELEHVFVDLNRTDGILNGDGVGDALPDVGCFEHGHPSIDTDGDSISDAAEVLCGTSPFDSESYLRVAIGGQSKGMLRLRWNTAPGRNYSIESTESLIDQSWDRVSAGTIIENDLGNSGVESFVLTNESNGTSVFYRVILED